MSKARPGEGKPTDLNIVLTDGGLGDHVASLVAVDYIAKNYPYVTVYLWVPDYLLEFAKTALPGVRIKNFTDAKKYYSADKPFVTTRWDGRTSGMRMHLLDYAFATLCDNIVGYEEKNYLQVDTSKVKITHFKLPEKYVVMTAGFTAPSREFLPEYVNTVVKYVKSKGYEVIFIGKKHTYTGTIHTIKGNFKEEIDFSAGMNLIDKTSLLEATKIMGLAKCVIGLDNGLLHLAGCTEVPIVGSFTSVEPKARMPVRHNQLGWNYYPVVPPPSLGCGFCQSRLNYIYDHDFKNCIKQDYECLTVLKPELYIEQLNKVL